MVYQLLWHYLISVSKRLADMVLSCTVPEKGFSKVLHESLIGKEKWKAN